MAQRTKIVNFGKKKVRAPENIANDIQSGEINPSTHEITQRNGEVFIKRKRKAVINGKGIIPTVNSVQDSNVPSANTAISNPRSARSATVNGNMPSANTAASQPRTTRSATIRARGATAASANATPAQARMMDEQQAQRIAPYKADVESLVLEANKLAEQLNTATTEEEINSINQRITTLRQAIGGANSAANPNVPSAN